MLIGYARTSTTEQQAGLEAQLRELQALRVEKVYSEQTSSVGDRPKLTEALEFVREGDTLVVTKLDRLARSVSHLSELVALLEKRGVALRVLSLGVDTSTPTGKLMLNLLGSIAQFEREVMLERQREGIARAKLEGRYKGRKPTARLLAEKVEKLASEGVKRQIIAERLGIGVASVYRILKGETEYRSTAHAISEVSIR
jgi:DNA invertase Pin-like site-specific DNA recombinase